LSGQLGGPAALPSRKKPPNPLDRSMGGLQSRSGNGGEEEISHPLPELEHPSSRP